MTDKNQSTKGRLRISQEMIAIITVGVALATQQLLITANIVEEGRAARAAWEAESQQRRNDWEAESQQRRNEWEAQSRQLRDEARSDREAFQREILRLTQGQTERAAIVAATPPKNE